MMSLMDFFHSLSTPDEHQSKHLFSKNDSDSNPKRDKEEFQQVIDLVFSLWR
jgi:hypothetical protein